MRRAASQSLRRAEPLAAEVSASSPPWPLPKILPKLALASSPSWPACSLMSLRVSLPDLGASSNAATAPMTAPAMIPVRNLLLVAISDTPFWGPALNQSLHMIYYLQRAGEAG